MTNAYRFLTRSRTLFDKAVVQSRELLLRYHADSIELQRVRKKYVIDMSLGFNIFTSISDRYKHENLHSDILALILDPRTDRIGTIKNAETLVKLLETRFAEQQKISLKCNENLVVEREKGRVDVLIHDHENAIIIENKINGAKDQDDQLPRYLERCDQRGLVVEAIIYLPLSYMHPSHEYSEQYRSYRKRVTELLRVLPAITPRTENAELRKPDYAHDFLDLCVDAAKQGGDDLCRIYLEQYSELIKYIGGRVMAKETNKRILKEILSSDDSMRTMKDLFEVWNNRSELIPQLIFDELSKRPGFELHPDNSAVICKKLDKHVSVGFSTEKSLGYVYSVSGDTLSDRLKTDLRRFIDTVDFCSAFKQRPDNHAWVYRDLDCSEINEPFDTLISRIARILDDLESAYRRN